MLASLKMDMSSIYVVMSKGKWEKQQPLEIQHGLTTKEEMNKGKSMEKAIKEAVDNAMKKWKASGEQAGAAKGGNANAVGDRAIGNQLTGTTLTPELFAVLLQGVAMKACKTERGE